MRRTNDGTVFFSVGILIIQNKFCSNTLQSLYINRWGQIVVWLHPSRDVVGIEPAPAVQDSTALSCSHNELICCTKSPRLLLVVSLSLKHFLKSSQYSTKHRLGRTAICRLWDSLVSSLYVSRKQTQLLGMDSLLLQMLLPDAQQCDGSEYDERLVTNSGFCWHAYIRAKRG